MKKGLYKVNKQELTKLVSAMVLGDGCLRRWKNVKNNAYSLSQIATHEDYVAWQKEILENICRTTVRYYENGIDKNGVNHQPSLKLETLSHPFFTTLRGRWYHDNRKTISLHDLKQFDAQFASIWYMDDGYILKTNDKYNNGNIFLCTDNFNEVEVIMLQKVVYEKLGIPFNVRKRGWKKDGSRVYSLVAKSDNAKRFLDIIQPFIFPSFEYKLTSNENYAEMQNEIV